MGTFVPKKHFLSIGTLSDSAVAEMEVLKKLVAERLSRIYGTVSMFEHGPGAEQRQVGCGVDHAHLHMVPADFDLTTAVGSFLPSECRWEKASLARCRSAAEAEEDYIYFEQPFGEGRMLKHPGLPSQLFRRAIAAHLGVPNEFNWRTNPQIENINATIRAFKADIRLARTVFDVCELAA